MATSPQRDRVTIDLRGLGAAWQARAAAERSTPAALARRAMAAWLARPTTQTELFATGSDAAPAATPLAGMRDEGSPVKLTIRLGAAHVRVLADRARQADVSQGAYVAGLLDGQAPPAQAPDHAQAIAALLASTDQLATLLSDLNAFMRLLAHGHSAAAERYRAGVMSLASDVRRHLAVASQLVAELKPPPRPAVNGRTPSTRRSPGRSPRHSASRSPSRPFKQRSQP